MDLLALKDVDLARLSAFGPKRAVRPDIAEQLEIEALYSGYLDRQEADILAFKKG
ncbi:MAG: hypothetical protein R3C42_04660 [Parvularculaceae bacterium]